MFFMKLYDILFNIFYYIFTLNIWHTVQYILLYIYVHIPIYFYIIMNKIHVIYNIYMWCQMYIIYTYIFNTYTSWIFYSVFKPYLTYCVWCFFTISVQPLSLYTASLNMPHVCMWCSFIHQLRDPLLWASPPRSPRPVSLCPPAQKETSRFPGFNFPHSFMTLLTLCENPLKRWYRKHTVTITNPILASLNNLPLYIYTLEFSGNWVFFYEKLNS